ncbi:solute carrier family 49 member 4 homolog [Amphibalanus amphitrite]|uniref:solute carrier family 49 member 4 homolog n=1 Tax=Amphibalanus amphitrite TaxID=1232801 RepID=UPI001C90D4A7|nr:solute carrier family 49 member 4 homolog [Amphibalanus amphitrite]
MSQAAPTPMTLGGEDHGGSNAVVSAGPADRPQPLPSGAEGRQSAVSDQVKPAARTYRRRWYILLLFSAIGFVQCAVWNTFGPITVAAQAAFPSWDNATISMLSNASNITYLVVVAPYCWLLSRYGLRPAVLLMTLCMAVGTALRSISSEETAFTVAAFACSVLNGIGGVMAMAAPVYLSSVWFPPGERTTATCVPAVSQELGIALSFVIGPLIVQLPGGADPHSDPDATRYYIMLLMDVETGAAAVLFLAVLLYFPSRPPLPPSASAAAAPPAGSFWRRLRQAARAPDLPWLLLAYVVPGGMQVAYFALLEISLAPLGVTQEQAGWLGFWASVASCVSALLVARLTDLFQGHVRATLLALLLAGTGGYGWLLAQVAGWQAFSLPSLYGATLLALAFTYATAPLVYEYAAELLYPVTADVIGAVLSVGLNVTVSASLLLLLAEPLAENTLWMNVALVCALPLGMAALSRTREVYRRTEQDRGRQDGGPTPADAASAAD